MHVNFQTIGERLPEYLGQHEIDPTKPFHCLNPEHPDKNPSAHLFVSKTGRYLVKCFACGAVYDIFDCASILDGFPKKGDPNWMRDNVAAVGKMFGVQIGSDYHSATLKMFQEIHNLLSPADLSSQVFKDLRTEDGGFLAGRLTLPYPNLKETLLKKGFSEIDIANAGIDEKRFNEHDLIFPLYGRRDVVHGFMTRKPESKPKYITTTNNAAFNKSEYLYGFFLGVDPTQPVWLVEGIRDALGLWTQGHQALAILGTQLTDLHIEVLKKEKIRNLILCLDGDDAGRKGMVKACSKLFLQGMETEVCCLSGGKDPLDAIEAGTFSPDTISSSLFYIQHLISEDGQEATREHIIDLLSQIESPLIRSKQVNLYAPLLGLIPQVLEEELILLIKKKETKETERIIGAALQLYEKVKKNPEGALSLVAETESRVREIQASKVKENQRAFDVMEKIDTGSELLVTSDPNLRPSGLQIIGELLQDGVGWWGKVNLVSADEHEGKSTIVNNLAAEFLMYNEDTRVVHLLTDDDVTDTLPKYIAAIVGNPSFTIRDALTFNNPTSQMSPRKREDGRKAHRILSSWLKEDRLLLVDTTETASLAAMEPKIRRLQEKYGCERLMLVVDSLHRVSDGQGLEENQAQDAVIKLADNMATRLNISLWATVEMRKMKTFFWTRCPDDIAGSRSQKYKAKTIWLIYSDNAHHNHNLDKAAYYHEHNGERLPRIKLILAKNKISGKLGEIYLDMFKYSNLLICPEQRQAKREVGQRVRAQIEEREQKEKDSNGSPYRRREN